MSDRPEIPAEVADLIDDYLSDQLDEPGLRQLEGFLRGDASLRQHFVRYCRLHTDLHLEARARQAAAAALLQAEAIAEPALPRLSLRYRLMRTAVAAALLLLAVGAGRWSAQAGMRAQDALPAIVARTRTLDFRVPVEGTLADRDRRGTGLTHRLPGTGGKLPARDPNLRLNPGRGALELTTTNSDINRQFGVAEGEYLGLRLADLGFTGAEDFAVSAVIPDFPALEHINQFGLYAGTRSDQNIRGGIFSHRPKQYTQNLVNNHGGLDSDSHFVGLFSPGDDLRLTLRRVAGKYSMTVENQTTGGSTTLSTRHPAFLDNATDLYVGLFGANTRSETPKTLVVQELQVTVWVPEPRR